MKGKTLTPQRRIVNVSSKRTLVINSSDDYDFSDEQTELERLLREGNILDINGSKEFLLRSDAYYPPCIELLTRERPDGLKITSYYSKPKVNSRIFTEGHSRNLKPGESYEGKSYEDLDKMLIEAGL
jgi:hypothetical protein